MLQQLIVLSCLFAIGNAAVAIIPVKLGGELKINGYKVTQWSRSLKNGDVETIKYSADSSEPNANKWINDKTGEANKISDSKVLADGTLIVSSFKKSDVGSYYSNEIKPRMTQHEDGLVTSVAAPMYNVILKNNDQPS
ncbi:hypothetical protein WR25_26550 [Diploscapter pachys]|uniref:Uncharacterized protein n=1 Tax=Diploscapter pachys TaxID=2018661 RepID=A0A2A2LIN4_9BILA|nr:hypothetical protein WR25_26550 [Diploscapter pachys]